MVSANGGRKAEREDKRKTEGREKREEGANEALKRPCRNLVKLIV